MLTLLADTTLGACARDDIVMFLSDDGDAHALEMLHKIASHPRDLEDLCIMGECGEAIGKIMCREGKFDMEYIDGLLASSSNTGSALHNALDVIKSCRPDWYNQFHLENLENTPILKEKLIIEQFNLKSHNRLTATPNQSNKNYFQKIIHFLKKHLVV